MLQIERSAWGLAISSAILQIVIFPLPNLYVLSWIAVAPLLVALLHARRPVTLQLEGNVKLLPARPLQGFLLGYLCGVLWYGGSCYWVYSTMKQYGGIGPAGAAGLLILFCLYLGLYHGLFGLIIAIAAKLSLRSALILAPFAWVAVELARTRISGFPWDLLGISQVDDVPLVQIARTTGVYGISFEIMVVNAAFAAAFLVRRNRRNSLLLAATAAAFVLQIARWMPIPESSADHIAVLVQQNIPVLDNSDWTSQYFSETITELSSLSMKLPEGERLVSKPDVIVWPESPAPFYSTDPTFRTTVGELAKNAHAWIVVGNISIQNTGQPNSNKVLNSASLVGPDGSWTARYDKVHLVPFGEFVPFKQWLSFAGGLTKEVGDFSRGMSRAPLQAGGEKLGVFICYESIFPDEVRQFAKKGAQVFVNVSNDGWYGDSGAYSQHLKQARMRAIENDRWLLRDTNTGVTASIDPYGRVVASVPRKVRTALVAPYALISETTSYTRHGDWLAYACAIISIGATVVSLTPVRGKFSL
jgi:apolipoprotein N-acyltransferase